MRYLAILTLLALMLWSGLLAARDVYVRGHYRSDGTYVQPHYRSAPNSTRTDNYSTEGNVNPYTGERGTVPLYDSTPRAPAPAYSSPPPSSTYRAVSPAGYDPRPTARTTYRPQMRGLLPTENPRLPPLAPVTTKAGLIARCRAELGLAAWIPQGAECSTFLSALWDGYVAGLGATPYDICPPAGTTPRDIASWLLKSENAGALADKEMASAAVLTTMRNAYPCH